MPAWTSWLVVSGLLAPIGVTAAPTGLVGTWSRAARASSTRSTGRSHRLAIAPATPLAFTGAAANDLLGASVSSAGDVNGDGIPDVIVGAPLNDSGGVDAGRAYVYFGGPAADAVADWVLTGAGVGDQFGFSVGTAGDVNRDGYADVIVGAPGSAGGAGRAYVYFGGPAADANADLVVTGAAANDYLGSSVGGAGDVNGDGYADVIAGAPGSGSDAGRAYVYFGGVSPDGTADLVLIAAAAGDQFGFSVGTAGDLNHDGYAEVIVGAPYNDAGGADAGRAYIFNGGSAPDAIADLTLTGAAAGDNFGTSVATAGDMNHDGFADLIVGAPWNDAGGADAGRAYVFNGGSTPDAVADLTLTGAGANDRFGASVATAGDVNRDGYADVIVGAPNNGVAGTAAGRAYVFEGGVSPDAAADLTLTGAATGDNLGGSAAGAGDVNGDGFADMIVGARANDAGGTDAGRAYLYYFQPPSLPRLLTFTGAAADDRLGTSVASAGDVNGDRYADVIAGAPFNDAGGVDAGRAYVYFGGPAADATADLILTGGAAGDEFGFAVGAAGDVNHDGYGDVIVGAPFSDPGLTNAGRAYIYYGGSTPDAIADLVLAGIGSGGNFGWSVGTAGDVNHDGYDDVIVGAPLNDSIATNDGQAFVYYGGATPNSTADLTLTGAAGGDQFGTSVGTAGDANRDGYADVVVGAPFNDAAATNAGRAYVFEGGSAPDAIPDLTLTGPVANGLFGISVGTAGDIDGDGYGDVIVGASTNDAGSPNPGHAYLYHGGAMPDALADLTLTGAAAGDVFGSSVGTAGDVNGDGFGDVIVGAITNDAGGLNAGRAYVYYGGAAADAVADLTLTGVGAAGQFGNAVATAGDVDGDGLDDVIVGSFANSAGGLSAGRAYLYLSDPLQLHATDGAFEDKVVLTWNAAPSSNYVFGVERNGTLLSYLGGDVTTYTDTGGDPNQAYSYCVKLYAEPGENLVAASCDSGSRVLFAPEALAASDSSRVDGVLLTWPDRSSVEAGYVIFRNAARIDTTGANVGSFTDTTAAVGVIYTYCVAVQDSRGFETAPVCDPGSRGRVLPPASVTASDGTFTSKVAVDWTDQSGDELGFEILRDGVSIATTGANAIHYNDTGALGVRHAYGVRAFKAGGVHSATVSDSGIGGPATMTPPLAVTATDENNDARDANVEISWEDPGDAGDHFVVRRDGLAIATLGPAVTSFVDGDAVPGTLHQYCVYDSSDSGGTSVTACDGGRRLEVLAPTAVAASDSAFEDRVEITWQSTSTTVVLFKLYRDGVVVKSVAGNRRNATDDECTAGETHIYGVSAVTALGTASPLGTDRGSRKLLAPTGVAASDNTLEDRVRVTWTDNSRAEKGYKILREEPGATVEVGRVLSNQAAFDDTTAVSPGPSGGGSAYTYRVIAFDDFGESRPGSDEGNRQLAPASEFSATDGSYEDQIVLAWADNSRRESGYRIYRDAALRDSVGANATSYTDATTGTHTYRVVAFDRHGVSKGVSDVGNTALQPPASVNASQTYSTSVVVTWVDQSAHESGYQIIRRSAGSTAVGAVLSTLGANVTSYVDNAAFAGITYEYCVRAVAASDTSSLVCDAGTSSVSVLAGGPAFAADLFGTSVATAGDVNGDGFADVIVGAFNESAGRGRAYLFYGGPTADTTADLVLTGAGVGDRFGISVGTAGDVNGDGYADVIVGASMNTTGAAGKAYVYYGGPSPDSTADLILTGAASADEFGWSVGAAGDVNGDGYADVIVGAIQNDAGGNNAGRAYVYYGGPAPDAVADLTLTGAAANDFFGFAVGTAGDVNRDGYADLIVGAHQNDAGGSDAGRAYVYYGGPSADATADNVLTGATAGDAFGISVGTAGDMNGDGYADVIVGAPNYDSGPGGTNVNAGRAYVFFGGSVADAVADLTLTGEAAFDLFGTSVGTAGDVNRDGFADAIAGAPQYDTGSTNTGRAYVYYGGPAADANVDLTLTGADAFERAGISVGTAGDVNRDGYADMIVGGDGGGGTVFGRAYVSAGGPAAATSAAITTPTNVSASDGDFTDRVLVQWDAVASATGYRIYRDAALVGTTSSTDPRRFDDRDAMPGRTYSYGVSAVANSGAETVRGTDFGRRPPNGAITGRITSLGGSGVDSVEVRLTPAPGAALELDGSLGRLEMPGAVAPDASFTVELWIRTYDSGAGIFSYATTSNASAMLLSNPQNLRLTVNGVAVNSGKSVNDGRWHHLAWTWTRATGATALYVDGASAFTGTIAAAALTGRTSGGTIALGQIQHSVGGGYLTTEALNGVIDDLRLWRRVRTATEIRNARTTRASISDPDLVGYWPLDQNDDVAAADVTTNARYGRFSGGAYWAAGCDSIGFFARTDLQGNYALSGLRYGSETTFRVEPARGSHRFEPLFKSITLGTGQPVQNEVGFSDVTTYTLTGTLAFQSTSCHVDGAQILVDGAVKALTDADGSYSVSVSPGIHTIEAGPRDLVFVPAETTLAVASDQAGIDFTSTALRTLGGKASGGCDTPIGTLTLAIRSQNGCLTRTVNATGAYSLRLPPQKYFVTVSNVSNVPAGPLDRADIVRFFDRLGEQVVDLTAADATLDLLYRGPLVVRISGFPSVTCPLGPGGMPIPIVRQTARYPLSIDVFEDYGNGNLCPVDTGTVTVFDEIIDQADQPVTLVVRNGSARTVDGKLYETAGNAPNIFAGRRDADGNDRDYQKSLTAVAEVPGKAPKVETVWALVTGHRPRTATFTAVSEGIPLLILRDPPGDGSSSFVERDQTYCETLSNVRMNANSHSEETDVKFGLRFQTGVAFFAFVSFETEISFTFGDKAEVATTIKNGNELQFCITTHEGFATSKDDAFVGSDGDVYAGVAMNLVFAKTDVIEVRDCHVVKSEAVAIGSSGFESAYLYPESHIRNTIMPQLDDLARLNPDQAAFYVRSKENWQRQLEMNASLKAGAGLRTNRSFSAGADYAYSQTSDSSASATYTTSVSTNSQESGAFDFEIAGSGEHVKHVRNLTFSEERTQSSSTSSSRTVGYTLTDNDAGDFFSVDVKEDKLYGTPVFATVSGRSSCPWEPWFDAAGNPKTQPRDGNWNTATKSASPSLSITPPTRLAVPPTEPAVFTLTLTNNSDSQEARDFILEADQTTNPGGAILKVNGESIGNGLPFRLAYGTPTEATLTVERGPAKYFYDDLHVVLAPACESASPLADTLAFSVAFDAPCSDVTLVRPKPDWTHNAADGTTVQLLLDNFELAVSETQTIDAVGAEYRRVGTPDWTLIATRNRDDIQVVGGKPSSVTFDWNVSAIPEGAYELRAFTQCSEKAYSTVATGTIDRTPPAVLGLPQPSDGVLSLGESISITYNEPIDCGGPSLAGITLQDVTGTPAPIAFTAVCSQAGTLVLTPTAPALLDLEGRTLRATVIGLQDHAGNPSATTTWDFVVRRSAFAWAQTAVSSTVRFTDPDRILVDLVNGRAQDVNFVIQGSHPRISAATTSGTLSAGAKLAIGFDVDPATPIGSQDAAFDAVARAVGDTTTLVRVPISVHVNVACIPPVWTVNPADFRYSMTVVAEVTVNGAASNDPSDALAAFVGSHVRGVAHPQTVGAKHVYFLTVYGNLPAQEVVRFRHFDASTCSLYTATSKILKFEDGATRGGLPDTTLLIATRNPVNLGQQSIAVNDGWTWFSLNRSASAGGGMDVSVVLGNLNPSPGDLVKAQDGRFAQFDSLGWAGSLSDLNNTSTYLLKLSEAGTILHEGSLVSPASTPIPVASGWNWIGYTPGEPLALSNSALKPRLATLGPAEGDVLRSQTAFAVYDRTTTNWTGSLTTLAPGQGLILYLNHAPASGTLTYPNPPYPPVVAEAGPAGPVAGRTATNTASTISEPGPGWSMNPRAYRYDMTVTADLAIAGRPITPSDVVAAVVNGEIRGLARPTYMAGYGRHVVFLMIRSNAATGDSVQFRVYDPQNGSVYEAEQAVAFAADAVIGRPTAPLALTSKGVPVADAGLPRTVVLAAAFPNPSQDGVSPVIRFGLPSAEHVLLKLFDVNGRLVQTLVNERMVPGWHDATVDARRCPSGIYFYRMQAGAFRQSRKLVMVR